MFPLKLFIPLFMPLLSLSFELPLWIPISGGFFILWRFFVDLFKLKKPSRKLTGFISVFYLGAIFFSFQTLLGREAAGSFLFVLTGLKILEYEKQEESLFLILLGLFLICTVFLFNIDLFLTIGLSLGLFYLTYLLIPENIRKKSQRLSLRMYIKTVLTALPVTLFLFFFFPRLSDVLWKITNGASSQIGKSGFSEDLKPGSVSEIVNSQKLVFRAEFLLHEKKMQELYWKGDILSVPQGFSWKKSSSADDHLSPINSLKPTDYKVLLEPQGQRWLFTLDGTETVYSEGYKILKKENGIFRITPQPEKALEYYGYLDPVQSLITNKEEFLILPKNFSSRVQSLVASWPLEKLSPEQKVKYIFDYFQKEKFYYTLKPNDLDNLTLEKFIFESKKGFCEHYASSLALLLRASGVPSRVVIGFLGGLYNDFGEFWTVREKEAHAWVEYVNSKGRWTRADATSVVAPLRLELGAEEFFNLPDEVQSLKEYTESIKRLKRKVPLYEQIGFWIQGLNYKWTSWLLNFDIEKQKQILSSLPLSPQFFVAIALCICLVIALLIQKLRVADSSHSFEDKYYKQVLSWKGFEEFEGQKSLGPTEVLELTERKIPELSPQLKIFFANYIKMAYGSQKHQSQELQISFKNLKKSYKKLNIS